MIEHLGYLVDPEAGLIYGHRPRPLGSRDSSGYLQIDGRPRGLGILSAHRLIWTAAHGPIPAGFEVNHKNGIKTDNRIANLELLTHQDNIRHAYRTGLKSNRGEKHPSRKLTDADVREIRRLRDTGLTLSVIGARYGVTTQNIGFIVRRKTWSHVGD